MSIPHLSFKSLNQGFIKLPLTVKGIVMSQIMNDTLLRVDLALLVWPCLPLPPHPTFVEKEKDHGVLIAIYVY